MYKRQGKNATYVKELLHFGEKCVNSKNRRCTYKLYQVVSKMPPSCPDSMVGVIKKQYSMRKDDENFVPDPNLAWVNVRVQWLTPLEQILRYLKLEQVRTALADHIRETKEVKDFSKEFALTEASIVSKCVIAFEEIAFKNKNNTSAKTIMDALVDTLYPLLEQYNMIGKVPPAPDEAQSVSYTHLTLPTKA